MHNGQRGRSAISFIHHTPPLPLSRVISWEPVELFRAYLHYGIAINNWTDLVSVRNTAISDKHNQVRIFKPVPSGIIIICQVFM